MFSKKSGKTPATHDDQESAREFAAKLMQGGEAFEAAKNASAAAGTAGGTQLQDSRSTARPGANPGAKGTAKSAPAPAMPSLISSDLRIEGNVESQGDLQLDGVVVGDMDCRTLTIGLSARVEGEVKAESVTVAGTVKGRIVAGAVGILRTARIHGDIMHDKLSIEAGALLDGRVGRRENAEKERQKALESGGTATALPAPAQGAGSGFDRQDAGSSGTPSGDSSSGAGGEPHSPL